MTLVTENFLSFCIFSRAIYHHKFHVMKSHVFLVEQIQNKLCCLIIVIIPKNIDKCLYDDSHCSSNHFKRSWIPTWWIQQESILLKSSQFSIYIIKEKIFIYIFSGAVSTSPSPSSGYNGEKIHQILQIDIGSQLGSSIPLLTWVRIKERRY